MVERTSNEIRSSFETAQRMGKIKGVFVRNTFEMPIGIGNITGKLGCANALMAIISFFTLSGYLILKSKTNLSNVSWEIPACCIVGFISALIISRLAKKILIFDFEKQSLFTKSTVLGKQCEDNALICAFSDIAGFAVDTVASRKVIQRKNGSRNVPLDYNIVKSRNFKAFSKFYDFFSNLIIINNDGIVIDFYPPSLSDSDSKKLLVIASVFSEAFGAPITVCPKDKKILKAEQENKEDTNLVSMIMSKRLTANMNLSDFNISRKVEFSEEGDLIVVPIFSEEDCLEMEKEAKANKGFWF